MGKQKPANDATNNVAGGERDIDVEGLSLRESCRLKENNGIPKDGVAAEDLSGPDNTILCRDQHNLSIQNSGKPGFTISVRRKLVPRKQSRKVALPVSSFSSFVV